MVQTAQVLQFKQTLAKQISNKVNLAAFGNEGRDDRDLCVDLINASGMDYIDIAAGTYLCEQTIKKLANDETLNPQHETIKRIKTFFGYFQSGKLGKIKPTYANKPKD